ncbi:hypothetical protein EYF80_027862 [Liparis tanakae]|uniref:Uncharacterized protein n=1 Tax=Liparis tanakae TaxID=230148 RepID=A0A4Z2H9K0_9TELE|nr:hypothetical protein EYF80_027862 [Liparis tanakae]
MDQTNYSVSCLGMGWGARDSKTSSSSFNSRQTITLSVAVDHQQLELGKTFEENSKAPKQQWCEQRPVDRNEVTAHASSPLKCDKAHVASVNRRCILADA